ncbi:MAG: TrbC/VirB2 family protein [Faecousia sp.]
MKTITTNKKYSAALRRGFAIVLMLVVLTMLMTTFAFAEDAPQATQPGGGGTATTIEEGVKTGMGKVYGIITAVVVPIAVVCLGVGAFQFFFGGERGVEKAKKICLYTLGGVALVYLAPLIVTEVASWFSSNGDAGVFG